MSDMSVRILCALIILGLNVLVFSGAWTWLSRYEEAEKELVEMRKRLKDARAESLEWKKVAEELASYNEGRTE